MFSKNLHTVLLILLPLFSTLAQVVIVRDKDTSQPIEHVLIFGQNKKFSTQTDTEGKADLSIFNNQETVFFQRTGYQGKSISIKELNKPLNEVLLEVAVLSFDEVVISANKWEQDSKEVPNKIVSISPEDIDFKNPQTAADMLASTGQVFVQKSQLGGGSPMLRGFAANRVLIVVDGVRMNNAIFRNGNLQNVISVDPNTLQGAEVLFGPGSVIYGSDALGGVMDFHTKRLIFSRSSKIETETNIKLRTSSANDEKTGHVDFSIAGEKFASYSSASFSDFDDLRSGSRRSPNFPDFGKRFEYISTVNGIDQINTNTDVNKQAPSGYHQLNLMQKFKWRPSNNLDIGYSVQYAVTSDIPRYDRLIQRNNDGTLTYAEWKYGPQKWSSHLLQAILFKQNPMFNQAKISLNYQAVEESRIDRRLGGVQQRKRTEQVNVYSINMDFDKSFNSDNQLFYGLEAFSNDVESKGIKTDIDNGSISKTTPRYPSGGSSYGSVAAYLSYKRNLNDRTSLTLGTRYSYVSLSAKVEDQSGLPFPFDTFELGNGALNGSIGLTYRPNETSHLNILASSGFRAPNIDDVGKVFEGTNTNIVVPNIGLKPEYSYNLELGAKKKIDNKLQIEATGFVSFLRDALVRRDFLFNGMDSIVFDGDKLKVQALVNTGSATIYGASFSLKIELSKALSVISVLTIMDGEDQESLPLRHVTPLFGETRLSYKRNKFSVALSSRYNGAISFEDLAPSEKDKAYLYTSDGSLSWYTINIRSALEVSKHFHITGAIENILDKHYRPYSSGISAAGVNFVLSVKARF